jgi:hypothetical protein
MIVYHDWKNDCITWEHGVDFEDCVMGAIHGVLFRKRGENDNHVALWHMIEDDGTWHVGEFSGSTSSAWIDDLVKVYQKAQKWLVDNCDRDPSGHGYIFRS